MINDNPMKIMPLAFESFGVRSMATFVETDQKILIDPGTSIAPKRFGYPPWKNEFDALYDTRARIEEFAKKADIITISHYHHDHYTPFELGKFLGSSPKGATELYRNKRLLVKHPTSSINKNQKKRAAVFLKNLDDLNCEVSFADDRIFNIGDTSIKFSNALHHGGEGSRLGYVIAVTIEWNGKKFMHASDIQGPINNEAKHFILDEKPEMLLLSGPPLYLQGFAINIKEIEKAKLNLIEIAGKIPKIVVDHHLLRDLRCFEFIKSVKENVKAEVLVASEILGMEPNLLEARRKEFYRTKLD